MAENTLTKRVKRHVIGRTHSFFAVTAPGLEHLCFQELAAISGSDAKAEIVPGGVAFNGRLTDIYRANLDLRTPVRITMRIARFKASNFRQFEKQVASIPWELHLDPSTTLNVNVKTIHSRLYHTSAISDRLRQGIAAALTVQKVNQDSEIGNAPIQNLFVRAVEDRFTISLDSSGERLYIRGLKTGGGRAPLRETLAAAALKWAGYTGREPLMDPMCGSGTFSLEAAMVSNGIPPGWYRNFAFMNWPAFKEKQWRHLKKELSGQINRSDTPVVLAADIDPQACESLESTARKFDLDQTIRVTRADFFQLEPEKLCQKAGIVALNPPFGVRLGSFEKSRRLYTEIASKLKKDYKGWRIAVFLSDRRLIGNFPAGLKRRNVPHGGLELTLLTGRIA